MIEYYHIEIACTERCPEVLCVIARPEIGRQQVVMGWPARERSDLAGLARSSTRSNSRTLLRPPATRLRKWRAP